MLLNCITKILTTKSNEKEQKTTMIMNKKRTEEVIELSNGPST